MNTNWTPEQLETELPAKMKNDIAKKHIKFYTLDGLKVINEIGARKGVNTVMQAAFFKLADIIPYEDAEKYMKSMIVKAYSKKGDAVVQMNYACVDKAVENLHEVKYPASWATTTEGAPMVTGPDDAYYQNFIKPITAQAGDSLPVSSFSADGHVPTGTTKFEKRGIAAMVPSWDVTKCIQCNQCSMVCPHACIRPVLATEEELQGAPATFTTKPALGLSGYSFRIQLSPLDCTGCGSCANVCVAKDKALKMVPFGDLEITENENYEFAQKHISQKNVTDKFKPNTIKGSQFMQPLFEFSGACAGCGETPYVKLVTQLFGDRMIVANATGCSSIYGGSAPTCPYTKNAQGHGPAWANSLFEDNAEFGYGMNLAYKARRAKLEADMNAAKSVVSADTAAAFDEWIANKNDAAASKVAAEKVKAAVAGENAEQLDYIKNNLDCLVKPSIWIFGGDGWAYDIGYGGLDHVLASGEDVNVLVVDTEVYSNTGGQASKATPTGSVAKFAAGGKRVKKKDLGMMAMSYGYVYVAQVAMGADKNQLLKALTEAEAYHGPSLIICYATCINHGIDMSKGQLETKKAVDAGYWQLYRYNPMLEEEGKNPFTLDSKEPTGSYQDFLANETRYTSLKKSKPDIADKLFAQAEKDAKERLESYKEKAGLKE